jgi:hypothetical protein
MAEVSYTHYSYCEDCLREGLKLLREADKEGAEMEPIDRLGVMKALDEAKIKTTSEEYDRIIDVIGSMPTINRWIPVTERLPDKNGRYLCTYKNEDGICVDFGLYEDGEWYVSGATAWMPLPESYEEGAK